INQKLKNIPLEYCIAAKNSENTTITYNCQFYPDNEQSGENLWIDLLKDGVLDNHEYDKRKVLNGKLAIAVAVQIKLKAHSREKIEFSLVWNMPKVSFHNNQKSYKKFYTRYFSEMSPDTAKDIACYSLYSRKTWQNALSNFRKPILENKLFPKWYKSVIFNELYYISDGGTVWFDIKDDPTCKHEVVREYGRFAYLEGQEYRMYNTYDVHFYANFALLKLWPKLQLSLQYEFADTIPKESQNDVKFLIDGKYAKQKAKNSLPHDIGDPYREPWFVLNAYNSHDPTGWKDLNLKFVLTVYRDYSYLKDLDYLKYMWPYIKLLMITVQSQDHDGDGLIDSEGLPDQTYDAWYVTGASAYCGGLHVAALSCICEIAKILKDDESLEKYGSILTRAKKAYNDKLWNGKYYKYDCSNSNYNDSIMTDMCCGHWYLRCSGFKHEVFEEEKIKKCIETIFDYNVMKYANGEFGSVNGMRPEGKVDITSMQSEEMWVGTTCGLASLMIFEGMNDKAWKTLEGMYDQIYNKLGLAFQTPEALMKPNVYRSLAYMRALCIWSVQYALEEKAKRDETN
ncbi:unnamed protein product, partial [Brachionus calyciflorus]